MWGKYATVPDKKDLDNIQVKLFSLGGGWHSSDGSPR